MSNPLSQNLFRQKILYPRRRNGDIPVAASRARRCGATGMSPFRNAGPVYKPVFG
jgi:hypothetical protein